MGPDGAVRAVARGWSNESPESAAAVGREIARRVAQRLASGDESGQRYLYGDRPLPEPILREYSGGFGPRAVITRNSYGSVVMNAADMMFVDIDREAPRHAPGGDLLSGVMSLFGKRSAKPAASSADPVVTDIQRVAESNSLAVRVYKTAAGYRVLVINAAFQPATTQAEALLRQFDSDPLYIRLCQMQQSFRARLTPKPWRCGASKPPVSFPFESPQDEALFREWEASYNKASSGYATCRYLTMFGGARMPREFEDLINDHDRETKAMSELPLA